MVFRVHLLTYSLYLTLVSVEETFAYSGYTVMPTRFFLGGIARRVDLHLLSDAEGNFGPWGVMDWACGSAVNEGGEEGEAGDEQAMLEREIDDQVRKAIEASRKRVREEYTRRKYKGKRSVDR